MQGAGDRVERVGSRVEGGCRVQGAGEYRGVVVDGGGDDGDEGVPGRAEER